jgi:ribosomal-protein-alanine N-acetyltransferase
VTGEVSPIASARLDLVSMSRDFIGALLDGKRDEAATIIGIDLPAGWPDDGTWGFLRMRFGQLQEEPVSQQWLGRALVERESGAMIGYAGFHGPPGQNALDKDDAVELGYTVFAPFRRRGYAIEAAVALMRWASEEHGIDAFVASVSPDNEPSVAMVRKLGFTHVGERMDDIDGLELVFYRRESA